MLVLVMLAGSVSLHEHCRGLGAAAGRSSAARKAWLSQARLLMPLAFATILGGMATLLTTTNIVVSSILRDHGLSGYGLLEFFSLGRTLDRDGHRLHGVHWRQALAGAVGRATGDDARSRSRI